MMNDVNTLSRGGGKSSYSSGGKPMGSSSGRFGDKQKVVVADLDTSRIKFGSKLDADLFNGVAKATATTLASNEKSNKPSQLRRFYDEICLWEERVDGDEDRLKKNLPFIRMMNAKAAYADGRGLVDKNFVKLMNHGLSQVESAETMHHFKLFMEAVMGFYKEIRPKES